MDTEVAYCSRKGGKDCFATLPGDCGKNYPIRILRAGWLASITQRVQDEQIQLMAKVERLRLISAPFIWRSLGSFGYRWLRGYRCLQTAELTLNLLIHFDDQLLVVVERSQRLAECEQVLWAIITLKRFRDRVLTVLYATMTLTRHTSSPRDSRI